MKKNQLNQKSYVHKGNPASLVAIVEKLTGLANHDCTQIIQMGGVYIGKHRCKDPQRNVASNAGVTVYYRLPIHWEPIPFNSAWIIGEYDTFLIAAKPAGLPTQGRRDADYMAFYELLKQNRKGYLGLHHRLDQGTSGLMLFSTNRNANSLISQLFEKRLIKKTYFAVCEGKWPYPHQEALIDQPIAAVHGPFGTKQIISRSGKPAQTEIRLLHAFGKQLLVRAKPFTGRTHQIRVHLSHLGIPLVGDKHYGSSSDEPFYLHCAQLEWAQWGRLKASHFFTPPPPTWHTAFPFETVHWQQELVK